MTMDAPPVAKLPTKRKRGWRNFWIIVGLIALYILGEYTIPRFPFGPYTLYGKLTAEQQAAVIPYTSLTDEQSYPFSRINSRRDYYDAIAKFPSVRDCLVGTEAQKQVPDLRLIDWGKLSNVADAEICYWRIFISYADPAKMRKWRAFHSAYLSATPWREAGRVGEVGGRIKVAMRRGTSFPIATDNLYGKLTPEQWAGVIAYERLADEQSHPFKHIYPKRDHDGAIAKFPNVRDCLVRSEKKKQAPDLRLINWDKIRNISDAEICTWRIFSSLGTLERAREWLVFHDGSFNRLPKMTISAEWGRSMRGIPFPTRGWRIFHKKMLSPGMFVRSTWSEDGSLQSLYWRWQGPL